MIEISDVKRHMRVEFNDEDDAITALIGAATEYVSGVTGVLNDADSPKSYDLACMLLIAHWFANREAVVAGQMIKVPYGFEMLFQSIRPGRDMI
ncbi:head-tail connector protein [Pseudogemmobacter bohemicus]|uniref:head-tail connector protein n=1 Tax=Pseudogemmobacter bohemicus TaxID=2250708 RepID=UPI000DD3A80D|nr:head-tail connector protein [Pseudogemmobacter bohemicus]